jgi:prepilin-type N-terminal cleavage/methylation domain-containing protein
MEPRRILSSRGFTLIELLVVISIIGLLASIVLSSLTAAESKGRDAVRLSDMQTIHTALEEYADNHGNFPSSIPEGVGTWATWECGNANTSDVFMPYLVSDHDIAKVPEETHWSGNNCNTWTECTYRYMAPVYAPGTTCGSATGNYAVIYMELENPAPVSYRQPICWTSLNWLEASAAGDPNGVLLILPM